MNKKLKIQFWKAEHVIAIQVLEHQGLENVNNDVLYGKGWTLDTNLNLDISYFDSNAERDKNLQMTLNNITEELFKTSPRIDECGGVVTATWEL